MTKKKNQPKFPIARIKKIIQENQEIGKISKTIPIILSRSLELFLEDILQQTVQVCKDFDLGKVQPSAMKKAIESSKYNFLEKSLEGIEDLENSKQLKRKKSQKDQDTSEPKLEKKIRKGHQSNGAEDGEQLKTELKKKISKQSSGHEDDEEEYEDEEENDD